MPELVEVLVRGKMLRDWQSVSVTRALDTAAGSFELTSPRRAPYPMAPGDSVEIYASNDLVLSGHVETVERSLGAESSSVRCSGRDNTADLVDCTAPTNPGEWRQILLPELVRAIAGPFGVSVDNTAGPRPKFDLFRLRPADTAWAAIERACRLRGVLVYSDGTSRLVMREAGRTTAEVELVEGDNLNAATFTADDSQRFRLYRVVSQQPGSDSGWGDLAALVQGEATDQGARPTRTLVVVAEAVVTNQTARERAQWEATVRAARAVRVQASLTGWRQRPGQGQGRLWQVNEQLAVRAPSLDLDRYLLVQAVTFTQNETSETTSLELVRADAYQPQPDLAAEDDLLQEWLSKTAAGELEPDDIEGDL